MSDKHTVVNTILGFFTLIRLFYLICAYTRLFLVTGTASREKEDVTNRRVPPGI